MTNDSQQTIIIDFRNRIENMKLERLKMTENQAREIWNEIQ